MIRCPACGRRLLRATPLCPVHGAPPPAAPPTERTGESYVVPAPRLAGLRVRRTLGQGGFGAVFLAERTSDGELVAIKVARADNAQAGESLFREADALLAIGAPNVPAVFARGTLEDHSPYVVMEFVRAPILADLLAALPGPMPIEELARHATAILTVLEIAHGRGYVHCDLKPENIFVDADFGAKLFDFGLVRRIDAGAALIEATREEEPAGTPEYMSPEQCEGRIDVDIRSDIYALGVMFYEMLAGAPPFWGNPADVQQSHRSRRPPALSRRVSVAPALEDAVMRCLAKDPERRFDSANELRRALSAGLVAERARHRVTPAPAVPEKPAGTPPAAPAGAKSAVRPTLPPRERRAVALLFFESRSNAAAVREVGAGVGAQLAHTAGPQFVLAFGHEVGDNPTRSAATAGEMIVARGLAKRVLVDLATVSVQVRSDGTKRYQSPLFTKKEHYPHDRDPAGVLLSPAAVEVLPDVSANDVPGRRGFLVQRTAEQLAERTTTRMGVAPLVGRDELLRKLLDSARAATAESRPTITTLLGEAGHGKSHLAQMLVQHLEVLPRLRTLFFRAKEVPGGAGEPTARELLQRTLGLSDGAPEDLGRALLADKLGPETARDVWAGVAVTMGWAPPEHPELHALAAAPGALRLATARAAGEGLRRMAGERALALVVEDAHFVDETALDAIEYATLGEAGKPIWACLIGRPTFARGRTGWAGRAAAREDLTLPPLDTSSAAELARRLLSPAENIPSSALARLAERTQGIPMLLVELVRGLKRDGIVRKSAKGSSWMLATDELERLPNLPLVQWLSSRETESLPPDLLAHARLASVLGAEFSCDEIEGVLQELERAGVPTESQLDATIGVRRLTESGILTPHRGERVGFRHALLRDTVYYAVPAAERESIHRAAYEYYRRQDRLAEGARLPRMAAHAAKSGLKTEAGRLYLDLARRASARHAYLDAELLYKNALENLPLEETAGQNLAVRGRGMMRLRLGRYGDALKDFDVAVEGARRVGAHEVEISVLLDEAVALDWVGDWARAQALTESAEALAAADPTAVTPLVQARLIMARGRTLLRLDRHREALEVLRQSADAAGTLGDEGYETYTQSLSMIGALAASTLQLEEGEAAMARALAAFESHGDMLGLAAALLNRCLLSFGANNVVRLLADYRRIIQVAREFGFFALECWATKDLGEVYFCLGRCDEAEPHALRAIEMHRQMFGGLANRTLAVEMLLARVRCYRGDVGSAAEIVAALSAKQALAKAENRADALFAQGDRAMLDVLELALRAGPDAEFDARISRCRELGLQPQDIVEMMQFKAISALRAGRREVGLRFLEETLAEADKSAKVSANRIRLQLDELRSGTAQQGARRR